MSVIRTIPIEDISPYKGQPRQYFDQQALQELANSIKTQGQYTPAWVVALGTLESTGRTKYELVAGERRWRACKLAGVSTLICEVRDYATRAEQYVASVMENFGRQQCTVMETARSVGQLLKVHKSHEEVATIFARSEAWVRQMASLNRLEPEVAAMLEPPDAKLSTQVALTLCNLQSGVQKRLAREIADGKMRHNAALSHVRINTSNTDRVNKQGSRSPKSDYNILANFLTVLGAKSQAIAALGEPRIKAMFTHRADRDRELVLLMLKHRQTQLRELETLLR